MQLQVLGSSEETAKVKEILQGWAMDKLQISPNPIVFNNASPAQVNKPSCR